jgi:hypothetical protein
VHIMQQEIFDLHLRLINVILKSGHSISRCQKCINISIPKRSDCVLADKLRNIHIYDCELNVVLGIKWKAAIFKAEESNQISESQLEVEGKNHPDGDTTTEYFKTDKEIIRTN